MWHNVARLIRQNRSFLITTHVFPDGDAVGSELALAEMLKTLGKKVLIVNQDPIPGIYRFLDPRKTARTYSARLRPAIARCDVAFIVDVSTRERVGTMADAIRDAGIPSVCIDHHETNSRFAGLNVVGKGVASTGEMICGLARALRVPLTARLARCLFVAVATDTGWFRFSNTNPDVLRIAAELVKAGAKPDALYEAVYETLEWRRMALMERVLGTLRSECGGRIAHMHLTRQMLCETGANQEDTEGFIDLPRVLRGVQMILFFREVGGKVKVSLRSKGGPPVHALAAKYGGGGHARAAGIRTDGPLEKVIRSVLADACRLFATREDT